MPVSSHNRSASLCSPSSFTFVLLLPLPFGRTDRSLQLLFYPRRTTLPQFSVFSLSFPLFDDASSPPRLSFPASGTEFRTEFRRGRERGKGGSFLLPGLFGRILTTWFIGLFYGRKKYSTGNQEIQDTSLITIVDPSGGEEECE